MSHCIATSIVLNKNEIIVKGGSNNVVPREHYTIRIPLTTDDIRTFVKQDLIGGCIQPVPSANGYFWWYVNRLLGTWRKENNKDYDTITDADCDQLWAMITKLYTRRRKTCKAVVKLSGYGESTYIRKRIRGGCYPTNKPLEAMQMSLYQAVYVASRYRDAEAVIIYK